MNKAIRALVYTVSVIPIVSWITGMGLSIYRLCDNRGFEGVFGYEILFFLALSANLVIYAFMAHMLASESVAGEKKRWMLVFVLLNIFAPLLWLLHIQKKDRAKTER